MFSETSRQSTDTRSQVIGAKSQDIFDGFLYVQANCAAARNSFLMKKLALSLAIVLTLSASALALDRNAMRAANNLAHEHMICASYSMIVASCLIEKNKTDPTGERYKELGGTFIERGVRIGDIAGVSVKASEARLKVASQSMLEEIENNCSNISILMQNHMKACLTLHNEGPNRLRAIAFGK